MNHDTLNIDALEIPYMETTTFGDYIIKIEHDDVVDSPREWDEFSTMVCWHSRYDLGDSDKNHYGDTREFIHQLSGLYDGEYTGYLDDDQIDRCWKEALTKNVILPLYLYDHSGITISTNSFSCPWDSGQVGWIFVSYEDIRKEYNWSRITKKRREKIVERLVNEVEIYDQYLTGEVYYFNIERADGEDVDSCGGFYGYDDDYMISVIKDAIKYDIEHTPQQIELFN